MSTVVEVVPLDLSVVWSPSALPLDLTTVAAVAEADASAAVVADASAPASVADSAPAVAAVALDAAALAAAEQQHLLLYLR